MKRVFFTLTLMMAPAFGMAAACDYAPSNYVGAAATGGTAVASGAAAATGAGMKAAGIYAITNATTSAAMLGSTAAGASAAGTTGIIAGTAGVLGTIGGVMVAPLFIGTAATLALGVAGLEGYCYYSADPAPTNPAPSGKRDAAPASQ